MFARHAVTYTPKEYEVFPNEPRSAIVELPYLLDAAPVDALMMVGLDADGSIQRRGVFPNTVTRPLDEPLLESSMWPTETCFVAAVSFSDRPGIDLTPLLDAFTYQGRTVLHGLWAGAQRWRSFTCDADGCCTARGNRYAGHAYGHDDFDPLPERPQPAVAWRRARWDEWLQAIMDTERALPVDAAQLQGLSRTLHDIPIRDAVLAYSADSDAGVRPAIEQLLARMMERSTLGAAIPVHTCAAAMEYLNGEIDAAALHVRHILEAEEYSLARLLNNGLEMRAPSSLLARSFAHYTPQDLLAMDSRAA